MERRRTTRDRFGSFAKALTLLAVGIFWLGSAGAASAHDQEATDASTPAPNEGEYWFPKATYHGPMGHAPIGVMADHSHKKGGWMLSVRYMNMQMKKLADGTAELSSQEVLAPGGAYDYLAAPTRMTTQMVMMGAMYAPIDRLTLMLMLPYTWKDMDHVVGRGPANGRQFTTETSGVGDLSLTAMVPVVKTDEQRFLVNIGFSFPTGSIDEKDATPLSEMLSTMMPAVYQREAHLPYPMQLGSGSYEFRPSVGYKHLALSHFDFGLRGSARIPMNENSNGYRLGEQYEVTAWGALQLANNMSASFRMAWQQRFNIHGQDEKLMTEVPVGPLAGTKIVPTAFPQNQGFRRLYGFWGLNLQGREEDGWLNGLRIAAEVGIPFWQSLDGPQLRDKFMAMVGLQYTF